MSSIDTAGINAQIPLQARFSDPGAAITENVGKAFELKQAFEDRQQKQQQLQLENQREQERLNMDQTRMQLEQRRLDQADQLSRQQYEGNRAKARHSWMANEGVSAWDVADRAREKYKNNTNPDGSLWSDQQINDAVNADVAPLLKQIVAAAPEQRDERGQPLFSQQDLQKLNSAPMVWNPQVWGPIVAGDPAALQRHIEMQGKRIQERKEAAAEASKAPTTRNVIQGSQEVTQQWNAKTRQWENIGQPGPRFAAQVTGAAGGFTGQAGDLLAALAEKGVSLPAGMRSKEQQVATANGLLRRNPGKSPDEIADLVKNGQIGFAGEKKETQVAAGQAGKIAVAQNEVKTFGPLVVAASDAMPRGRFVPWQQLKQRGLEKISDPQLKDFAVKMRSLENAYESLAARGGTDVTKREHIAKLFNTADSPAAVRTLVNALNQEAAAAEQAARQAMVPPGRQAAAATPPAGEPKRITSKADYDALPSGAEFVDDKGKRWRKP